MLFIYMFVHCGSRNDYSTQTDFDDVVRMYIKQCAVVFTSIKSLYFL